MTTDRDEARLDALLAEARAQGCAPSGDLMARVLADADRLLAERPPPAPRPARPRPLRAPLDALLGALGGWPALGGLAAATVLGVALGAARPTAVSALAASLWGDTVSVPLAADDDPLALLEG